MMKLSLCALVPLASLLAASTVSAQQYAGHCSQCQARCAPTSGQSFHGTYYDNSIWPRQYMAPSRRAICQAFSVQVAHGWRRNNLLGKYDFAPDGEGLSEAGRLRVEWILTLAPPNRRTIFIQRGADQAETAVRVEAVQTLASTVNPSMGAVDVQETDMRTYGRPAADVDAMFIEFQKGQLNDYPPTLQASGIQQGAGLGSGQ